MKIEVQNLLHERNDIIAKNTLIEREYNTIREELRKYQEKFNESSDAVEQFKSEVKMLKHELDISHEKLALKQKESKYSKFTNSIS
jgi:chromosome segregation ATPase